MGKMLFVGISPKLVFMVTYTGKKTFLGITTGYTGGHCMWVIKVQRE
jgi:hypothetical protein